MSSKINTVYIYKLVHPVTLIPFYVGATVYPKTREKTHNTNPKTKTGKELKKSGLRPLFIILEECKFKNASKRETFWISECGESIENYYKKSSYLLAHGTRHKLDKKVKLELYLKESEIKEMGGEKKAIQKLYAFVEREVLHIKL